MKILDLSAGNRAVWFNKKHPLATFCDIRPEVEPDVVVDTKTLVGFEDGSVDLFVFDPPHVNFGANAEMSKTYGHHTTEQIREIIQETARTEIAHARSGITQSPLNRRSPRGSFSGSKKMNISSSRHPPTTSSSTS